MKIGNQNILGIYLGNQSVRVYMGSQLILPTVTISGTWNPSLTNKNKKVVISGDVTLTGKTDCYSLTFETGGHLTINAGARLRIWQGGITNNDCTTINYLTIVEDAVNDIYGEFLLHPDVSVNNHPLASVEFISKGHRLADNSLVWQQFGIPSFGVLAEVTATAPTAISAFNRSTNEWNTIGLVGSLDYSKMAEPFELYQTTSNVPDMGTVVTMKGQLYGNESPELVILGNFYNGFTNTYTGTIKTSLLLSLLAEHNISSINVGPNNIEINASNVNQWPYIQPGYCRLIILNRGTQFNITLNYKDLVWDPSFEEEVTPTRSLLKGALTTPKPVEIDTTLEGSRIFDNPVPAFLPEHDER